MSRHSLIFYPVSLRKDREHSWKHHARRSLTREVLGIVDVLAAKNEQRFVFIKLAGLLRLCFKGLRKDGKHYSLYRLKHVLEELRAQHIISHYRETADGKVGFVMAPHDSLCFSDRKTCILPNRSAWRGANETLASKEPDWRTKVKNAIAEWQRKQHRCSTELSTDAAPHSAPNPAPHSAPPSVINSTELSTELSTAQSLYDANFALLSESEKADWLENGMQFGTSNRQVMSSDEPKEPCKTFSQDELQRHEQFLKQQAEKQKQHQTKEQPQQQERSSFSFSDDRTDKEQQQEQEQPQRPSAAQAAGVTIGVHFANCTDILDKMTDGQLDDEDYHCADEFQDWTPLSDCARAAVDAKKECPYLGLQTNAALMRDTMKRLKKQHKLNVPEPWLPIMDAMQGCTAEMKAEKKHRKLEESAMKAGVTDKELEIMQKETLEHAGRQPCQEWTPDGTRQVVIMRTPEDRIALGFNVIAPCTVTGVDDFWMQNGKPVWHRARNTGSVSMK